MVVDGILGVNAQAPRARRDIKSNSSFSCAALTSNDGRLAKPGDSKKLMIHAIVFIVSFNQKCSK